VAIGGTKRKQKIHGSQEILRMVAKSCITLVEPPTKSWDVYHRPHNWCRILQPSTVCLHVSSFPLKTMVDLGHLDTLRNKSLANKHRPFTVNDSVEHEGTHTFD
jgi:hypothetical protein